MHRTHKHHDKQRRHKLGYEAFEYCYKLIEVCNKSKLTITVGSDNNGYIGYYAKHIITDEKDSYLADEGGYIFYEDGTDSYLIGYTGTDTDLTLPKTSPSGKNYTIYQYAFTWFTGLTSITIPDSVTSIGDYAFSGCSGLTSITLPFVGATGYGTANTHFGYIFGASSYSDNSNSVPASLKTVVITGGISIGNYAFSGCSGLTSVHIKDIAAWCKISFYSYNSNPLYYAHNLYLNGTLVTDLIIPNSVTSIGVMAFYNCSGLTSITIPNSVTSIGEGAFEACTELTSITLPDSVTSIGSEAFYDCSGLISITIPDSVTSIGSEAFYNCSGLTSITLPFVGATKEGTTNTHFGYIFGGSVPASLKTVVITGGISIGNYAFSGCSKLTSITIPDGVESIGNYAFSSCSKLTSITIGNGVTSIGNYAFSGCSKLTSITIPDSVTSIGNYAFSSCSKLTSITIGNGVKSIGDYAFKDCSKLASITVDSNNAKYHSSDNCLIETDTKTLIAGCKNSVIPNDGSVTSIGDYAFEDCSGLTSITIPDSVTSIGSSAFRGCSGLTSITLPFAGATKYGTANTHFGYIFGGSVPASLKTVVITGGTSIGSSAFSGCSGLTSITIPDSVTSIGDYAFEDCSGLTSITIPDSVTSIGVRAFYNTAWYNNQPDGLVYAGKVAYTCKGACPSTVIIKDGTLGIANHAFFYCELTSITIPDSVTSIGEGAFLGCEGLTSITIGNSVTSIGEWAFYGCSGLTSVHIKDIAAWCKISFYSYDFNPLYYAHNLYLNGTLVTDLIIPDSVTSIGSYAFYGCSGLTSITIGNSVTSIGYEAFYGCSGLTSITIGNSVTSIGYAAFSGCTGLKSITIPFIGATKDGTANTYFGYIFGASSSFVNSSSVPASLKTVVITGGTSIGEWAFEFCSGLTSITIGNGVESIGSYAFSHCSKLTSVTIPDSVTSIGSSAFWHCSGLTSITIPDSVTSIGEGAFLGCEGLTSITYNGTKSQLNAIFKYSYWNYLTGSYTVHCADGDIIVK